MIKGQLDKTKELILAQWKRLAGSASFDEEGARRLLEEQAEDAAREDHELPQYIAPVKGKELAHLKPRDRAIYICRMSRAFTDEEIGGLFGVTRQTVWRIAKQSASGGGE